MNTTDASTTKAVGRISYKHTPPVFGNKEKIVVHIKNFADLEHRRGQGKCVLSFIQACGYAWYIDFYARGRNNSSTEFEYISIFLCYNGNNTDTDLIDAKAVIRTKTTNRRLRKHGFVQGDNALGYNDFSKRDDVIQNDCNEGDGDDFFMINDRHKMKKDIS